MSGLFGGKPAGPTQEQLDAQARADERATAQEQTEMQGAQARRRLRRTGGMRLLFSPARREGPGNPPKSTKLGGGS